MAIDIVTGESATANVASQTVNLMLYGPPGTEKTTDAVRAFVQGDKCTAFFIPCEDGALKPILARGLPVPDHPKASVKSWNELQETFAWLGQNRKRYNGVIIDTISTFTMYLNREIEARFDGNKNKFAIPLAMRNCLFLLREWCRAIDLHCIMIAHAIAPDARDGVLYKGGPLLAPKTMIEQYHGQIDSILRVDYLSLPGKPAMRVYWTGGEEWPADFGVLNQPADWRMWRTKNREGCAAAVVPADLGAFLRARRPAYVGL